MLERFEAAPLDGGAVVLRVDAHSGHLDLDQRPTLLITLDDAVHQIHPLPEPVSARGSLHAAYSVPSSLVVDGASFILELADGMLFDLGTPVAPGTPRAPARSGAGLGSATAAAELIRELESAEATLSEALDDLDLTLAPILAARQGSAAVAYAEPPPRTRSRAPRGTRSRAPRAPAVARSADAVRAEDGGTPVSEPELEAIRGPFAFWLRTVVGELNELSTQQPTPEADTAPAGREKIVEDSPMERGFRALEEELQQQPRAARVQLVEHGTSELDRWLDEAESSLVPGPGDGPRESPEEQELAETLDELISDLAPDDEANPPPGPDRGR